jgi:quinol monooxygenase YgiN
MHARLVQFKLEPGSRTIVEKIFDDFNVLSRKQQGFRGNAYFFDLSSGEYCALNYWDSYLDAERANRALLPKLQETLENVVKEEPFLKIFEVYDPLEKTH